MNFEPGKKVSRDDPSLQTIAVIAPRGATGRGGGGNHWNPLDLWNHVVFCWTLVELGYFGFEWAPNSFRVGLFWFIDVDICQTWEKVGQAPTDKTQR